jgi:hypothetical protein
LTTFRDELYVPDVQRSVVLVFGVAASGDTAPLRTMTGDPDFPFITPVAVSVY